MSSKISASNGGKKKKATSTNSNDKSLSSSEEVISLVDASSSEEEDNVYGSDLQIIEPKHSRGGSTKSRKQHSTKKSTTTKRNENSIKCLKNPPSPPKPCSNRRARDMGRGKSGWGDKGMSGLGGLSSPQSMAAQGGRSKNSNNRRAISTSSTQSSRMVAWNMGRGKGRSGVGRKVTGAGRMLGGVGMDGGDNKHDRREMFLRSLESRRLREDIDTARSIKRQKKTGAADMDLESFTAAASGASGTGGLVNLADDDSVPSIEGDKKPAAIQLSGKQQGHTNGTIIELDNEEGSVTIDFDSMTTVSNVGGNGLGVVGGTGSINMSKMMEDTKDAVIASGLYKSTAKRHYLLSTSVKMHKNQSTTFPSSNTPVILFEPTSKHVSDAGTQAKLEKINYGYLSFRHNHTELFRTSQGRCTTAVDAFNKLAVEVPGNHCDTMRYAAGLNPRENGQYSVGKWGVFDVIHVPKEKVLSKDLTWADPPEESKAKFVSLLPSNLANNGEGGWADPTIIHPSSDKHPYNRYQLGLLRIITPKLALALPNKPSGIQDVEQYVDPVIKEGVEEFRALGDGNDHRQTARSVRGAGTGNIGDGVFQPTLWKNQLGKHKVTPNVPELVETVQQEARVLYDIYSHCQPESFSSATSLKKDKKDIVAHVRDLLAYR